MSTFCTERMVKESMRRPPFIFLHHLCVILMTVIIRDWSSNFLFFQSTTNREQIHAPESRMQDEKSTWKRNRSVLTHILVWNSSRRPDEWRDSDTCASNQYLIFDNLPDDQTEDILRTCIQYARIDRYLRRSNLKKNRLR